MRRIAVAATVLLCVCALAPAAEQPVELRGAWTHPTSWKTQADADRMLDRADAMNLNALFMLVYYYGGQAAYRTDLAPMLEGVEDGFDPLGYAVAEGGKRGIEVHAWFVNGPGRTRKGEGPLEKRPEWKAMDLMGRRIDWFDLCRPEVRAYQARLMLDCLKRYPVASLHFDYIRFPGRQAVCACPECRRLCREESGVDLDTLRFTDLPAIGEVDGNPLAQPTTVRTLVRFENSEPALAIHDLGKGRVVLLNWKPHRWCPVAVATAVKRLLAERGVKEGDRVLALDHSSNKDRRWQRYQEAQGWAAALGYVAKRATDEHLTALPPGAAVFMEGFYDMPDEAAEHLTRHVEAGGVAVFMDGPVFAVNRRESARQLLGFKRSGKYFKGVKELHVTDAGADLVPHGKRSLDLDTVRADWAKWTQWRKDQISDLVRKVAEGGPGVRPGALVTAAVFRTKEAAESVHQDWPRWHREGWCDYVIPMSYVETPEELDAHFGWWKQLDPPLARIIPAVGAFKIAPDLKGEARAAEIGKQVAVCRRHGARGVCLFVLKAIDDATATALGRTVFPGKAKPYRPPARN